VPTPALGHNSFRLRILILAMLLAAAARCSPPLALALLGVSAFWIAAIPSKPQSMPEFWKSRIDVGQGDSFLSSPPKPRF